MATRYWVGGSGTWSAASTTNWSASSGGLGGASAPTAADTVVFDNNSNILATAFTVTVSAAVCLDMTFGSGASALDGAMTLAMGTSTLTVSGNWTNPATNFAYSGTGTITFNATSSKTITTNGISMVSAVTFNGVSGTWALQDALTTSGTTTLTNGTLNLNNKNLTCNIFSSNNSNIRTIAFGTGQIYVTGSSATIVANAIHTNLTITGTPIINATYSGAVGSRVINMGTTGGTEASSISLNVTAGSDSINLGTAGAVRNLDFSGFSGTVLNKGFNIYGNLIIASAASYDGGTATWTFASTSGTKTITINGEFLDFPFTFNGLGGSWEFTDALNLGSTRAVTFSNGTLKFKSGTTNVMGSFVTSGTTLKYLASTTAGSQATISDAGGSNTVTYLSIQDSNATGGATWDARDSTNVNVSNNSGWLFSNGSFFFLLG